MSYAVETTGTLVLPEELERQALTVLEVELAGRQGAFDDSQHVDDLASLALFAGAEVRRDDEEIRLSTAAARSAEWLRSLSKETLVSGSRRSGAQRSTLRATGARRS